jgi:hypothetical protein
MLFDMEDYLRAGVIGQSQLSLTPIMISDMGTTARQTRDAFFKGLTQWYNAANIRPAGTCKVTPQSLWAEISTKKDAFIIIQDEAWKKMEDSALTRAEYDAYVAALKDLMKTIKKLFIVLEGGKLKKV